MFFDLKPHHLNQVCCCAPFKYSQQIKTLKAEIITVLRNQLSVLSRPLDTSFMVFYADSSFDYFPILEAVPSVPTPPPRSEPLRSSAPSDVRRKLRFDASVPTTPILTAPIRS